MGFASGVRAGTGLVESILAERRAKEEFGWKRDDRSREEGIRTREDALRDENIGLIRDGSAVASQPQQGIVAPPPPGTEPGAAAAPAVAAAQGAAGVRLGTAQGIPTNAPGSPQPDVPVAAGNSAAAIAGTATAPTPQVQATPAAGPQSGRQLGRDELIQRNLQQQQLLRGNVQGYNTAKAGERAAGIQSMTDEAVKGFMAMPQEKREELAYSPNLTGDIPMVTTATDKNGMTVIAIDPKTGRPMDSGKPIKLSWADAAQLHAANQLAQAGFGAEAIDMAAKVNARIGEAVKANNELVGNAVTKNTDAAYKGGMLAETKRHHGATEAQAARNAAATANYYKSMGAKEAVDEAGNLVFVVPQTDRAGNVKWARSDGKPTMEGLRVKPTGGGRGSAPKEIPAAGVMMEDETGTWQSDGKGGRLSVNAPLPADRVGVLKNAGLSGGEAKNVTWVDTGSRAGEFVTFPGATMGYDPRDPEQVAQMRKDMKEHGIQRQMGIETTQRVATAPARRAQREQQMNNLSDPNRFGPGVGLPLNIDPNRRDLYINTDE